MKLPTETEIEEMKSFFNIIPRDANFEFFFEPIENNILILQRSFYNNTLRLFRNLRENVLKNLMDAKDTKPIINYCLFKLESLSLELKDPFVEFRRGNTKIMIDKEDYERINYEQIKLILNFNLKELISLKKYFKPGSYKKPFLKKSNSKINLFFKTISELENLDTIDEEFRVLFKDIAVSIFHFLNPLISIRRLQAATRNYLNYFYLNLESERIVEGHKILLVDKPFLFTPWIKSGISPAHSSTQNNTILIGKVPKNLIEVIIEHEIIEILTESHTEGVRAEEKKALELGVMQDLIKYRKKLEKLGMTIT